MTDKAFSWRLTYTGVSINRAAELRPSSDQIEKMQISDNARVLPVWNGMHLFETDGVAPQWISVADAEPFLDQHTTPIFLGVGDDAAWFTLPLTGEDPPARLVSKGNFEALHPKVGSIHADQAALLCHGACCFGEWSTVWHGRLCAFWFWLLRRRGWGVWQSCY